MDGGNSQAGSWQRELAFGYPPRYLGREGALSPFWVLSVHVLWVSINVQSMSNKCSIGFHCGPLVATQSRK